jgi:hypothetical protein
MSFGDFSRIEMAKAVISIEEMKSADAPMVLAMQVIIPNIPRVKI